MYIKNQILSCLKVKFFNFLSIFIIFLVLFNTYLIPYFYKNFWFLFVTLFISFLVIVLVNISFKKYGNNILLVKKSFNILVFIICVFNLSFLILLYSLNFIKEKRISFLDDKNKKEILVVSTQIKGKVLSLIDKTLVIPNAKLTLIHKDTNIVIDVLYTNSKGEFEYKLDRFLKEGGNFELKIEHPDYKTYTTDFKVLPFSIKELEIFLQPKKYGR